VFERLFKERGLPANIRSDNGVPFASAHALFNLSKLAVWWLRLGIGIERIKPGHPQQNGRHERMHLTLKKEATKPAVANFLQQQARFDKFIEVFNNERPHEALDMKCPAEVYQPSPRPYSGLPDIDYPLHDKTIVVTRCGLPPVVLLAIALYPRGAQTKHDRRESRPIDRNGSGDSVPGALPRTMSWALRSRRNLGNPLRRGPILKALLGASENIKIPPELPIQSAKPGRRHRAGLPF
jgi:hypothetical protein